jgi:lipopolysaccharide transport system permease protein
VSDPQVPGNSPAIPVRSAGPSPRLGGLGIPNVARLAYLAELTRELVARDLKLRYKRTILGVAWSLVNPIAQWLVLGFVFGYVIRIEIDRFLSYLFTGILVWSWLSSSLSACATCVLDNSTLLRRPGFPGAILPVVAVSTQFVQFAISLPILLVAALFDGEPFTWALLGLPVIAALQFLLTLGIGYFLATLHVVYRDTKHLLEIALMLAFYLTPIFYDSNSVPEPFRFAYQLNPAFHLLEAYRAIVVWGILPRLSNLVVLGLIAFVFFALGLRRFRRRTHSFAEDL